MNHRTLLPLLALTLTAHATDWPMYRGPKGDGSTLKAFLKAGESNNLDKLKLFFGELTTEPPSRSPKGNSQRMRSCGAVLGSQRHIETRNRP